MASSSSFDIVCEMNLQEVTNAVDQARREVANRYDFRGSKCEIELDRQDNSLRLTADDEMKMQTLIDVLLTKLVKREVPTKALVYGKTEPSGKLLKKQTRLLIGEPYQVNYDERSENVLQLRLIGERFFDTL